MSDTKNVLGKGLSALIPNSLGDEGTSWSTSVQNIEEGEKIVDIAIDVIEANPWQPRRSIDRDKLEELAQSIKEHGILQPLIVTSKGKDQYQLVAGERRLKAAEIIGMQKVPVVIRKIEDQKKLEISLIENLQRHNLNPLDEALSYKRLMDEFKLTQEEVAQRVGRSRPSVANFLRLLTLPRKVLEALASEQITFSHAKVILMNTTQKVQLRALARILKQNLSVAEADKETKKIRTKHHVEKDPVLASWEEKLTDHLGFRTNIMNKSKGGNIEIHYSSDEDLKSLLDKLIG